MEDLVYSKFFSLKSENCFGCQFDYSSLKGHTCGLADSFADCFYMKKAIDYFLERGEISTSEANSLLTNWYKKYDEEL